jgi:predicted nucleic acid-binding protein
MAVTNMRLRARLATCRDPNDLIVLGLVVPGDAQAILTGDKDLLVLGSCKGASIMTPRTFWGFCQSEV